jgi:hypothetical protein
MARVVFLVEMGFAALHKANRDFFDPHLSCAFVLSEMVPQWWDTPVAALAHLLTPPVVLALEAAIPVLVLAYWPLGLLLMLGFLAGLGAVGPTGFTGVTIAAGFSFVRGTRAAELYGPLRERPWAFAAGGAALAAYVAWAHRAPPDHPPAQFVLYFVVVAGLGALLAGALARDLRRRSLFARLVASLEWPRAAALRVALVVVALVGIVDGLTPYLGYKYHFSFSMLSNLRADGLRWNSWLVPEALRMVDADPFVRVTRVRIRRQGGRPTDPDRELFEAYFPPYEFVRRVDYHLRHGHEVHVWIEWEGREHFLPRIGHNPEARAFLDALPRALLFQTVITAGPQPCVH